MIGQGVPFNIYTHLVELSKCEVDSGVILTKIIYLLLFCAPIPDYQTNKSYILYSNFTTNITYISV